MVERRSNVGKLSLRFELLPPAMQGMQAAR
jgi:hypothetical protein